MQIQVKNLKKSLTICLYLQSLNSKRKTKKENLEDLLKTQFEKVNLNQEKNLIL